MVSSDLLVLQTFVSDDVFLSLGCVKVDWQLNPLGLVDSEGQIGLFL